MASGFHSCEKANPELDSMGSLKLFFSSGDLEESGLKSDDPDSPGISSYHAHLTVIDKDSVPVLEDELFPLYKFSEGFFSERIELKVGYFMLVKFMIINSDGEVVFVAPVEGSPKAYLVKDPLPIGFRIRTDETTQLSPEVLHVNGDPASEFGYSVFGFSIVNSLSFYIAAVIDDPRIMAPTMYTEAALSVFHPDGWQHNFYLRPMVNEFLIRGGARSYKFIIEKQGFRSIEMEVPAVKLMETTKERPLLVKFSYRQNVLVIQPDPITGKDATVWSCTPDRNMGKDPDYEAMAWTWNSMGLGAGIQRGLMNFDFSSIPDDAKIDNAYLSLYNNPNSSEYNGKHSSLSGSNAALLQRIVEPWDEDSVTWNKQPKSTAENEVYLRQSVTEHEDYENINVTLLVQDFIYYPSESFGFLIKLETEQYYRSMIFASSDHPNENIRPKLVVYYTTDNDQ
jgi:hypothetical protein